MNKNIRITKYKNCHIDSSKEEYISYNEFDEEFISHLDGALKECMRELRSSREEKEQKLHEAMVKKTREWDK